MEWRASDPVLYMNGFLFVLVLAFFAVSLRRLCRQRSLTLKDLAAALRGYRRAVQGLLCPGWSDSLGAKVREIEDARKVDRARAVVLVIFVVMPFDLLMTLVLWVGDGQALASDRVVPTAELVIWSTVVFAAGSCPHRIITTRFLKFVHLLAYADSMYMRHRDTKNHFAMYELVLAGIVHGDFLWTAALTVVHFAGSAALLRVDPVAEAEYSLFIVVIVGVTASARNAEVRALIKTKEAQGFRDVLDGLLSKVCDAVVHLSPDLRMSRHSPHLATMLLRSPHNDTKGSSILDMVAGPDEAARVADFLNRQDCSGNVLPSCLRDSDSTVVRVRLFHARGRDANDEVFHIVGIQEEGEPQRPPALCEEGAAPLGVMVPINESAPSSVASSDIASVDELDALVVWVDHMTDGLPIVKSSAAFTALTGPCPVGAKFLEWVVNREELEERLYLAGASYGGGARPLRLALSPPQKPPGTRALHADAEIELVRGDEGQDAVAMLTLRNLRGQGAARGRRRRSKPRRPEVDVDVAGATVLTFDVLGRAWEVTAVSQRGEEAGPGPRVGDNLLDWFEDPDKLVNEVVWKQESSFAADVQKFLRRFRPVVLGDFSMHDPRGDTARSFLMEVAVIKYSMSSAGTHLCCSVALRRSSVLAV